MGIVGKNGLGNTQNEADLVQASLLKGDYEHHTLAPVAPLVNAALSAQSPGAFGVCVRAHTVIIRTNADITIRFNNAANHAIPISAAEGGLTTNTLEVTEIFITAPAGSTVKFFMV